MGNSKEMKKVPVLVAKFEKLIEINGLEQPPVFKLIVHIDRILVETDEMGHKGIPEGWEIIHLEGYSPQVPPPVTPKKLKRTPTPAPVDYTEWGQMEHEEILNMQEEIFSPTSIGTNSLAREKEIFYEQSLSGPWPWMDAKTLKIFNFNHIDLEGHDELVDSHFILHKGRKLNDIGANRILKAARETLLNCLDQLLLRSANPFLTNMAVEQEIPTPSHLIDVVDIEPLPEPSPPTRIEEYTQHIFEPRIYYQ